MKHNETAKNILEAVGGAENVEHLTYCATRLRFDLYDRSKVDLDKIKKMEAVLGTNITPKVFQLIIGADVQHVYREMNAFLDNKTKKNNKKEEKKGILNSAMDALAGTMMPLIPAIYAAGLFSALLALLKGFKLVPTDNSTYIILNSIQQAIFYYLPIMVGASAAKRFGCNQYIGMALGAVLVFSSINGVEGLSFLGIPVLPFSYNATVLPVLFGVWFMSYVDRFSDKYLPKSMIYFVKPLLALLLTVPMTLLVFGPMGGYFGKAFSWFIEWVRTSVGGWLVPAIKGATTPISVLTGTTGIFFPIVIGSITELGYDALIMPGSICANMAVAGAVLALAIITKNKETRQLAITSGTTALLGITEPAIYGVLVKYKTAFLSSLVGGGVGGLIMGVMGIRCYAPIASLIGLPAYIDDTPGFRNLIFAIISAATAFAIAFAIVWFYRKKIVESELAEDEDDVYYLETPVNGKKVDLNEVKDETFSSMVLGKGIAIVPENGEVFAPEAGKVTSLFETNHAIGLTLNNGLELLIHIGIDTVKLKGKHFTAHVKQGDKVSKGQKLVSFDLDALKKEGYDTTVVMIVTNSDQYSNVAQDMKDSSKNIFVIS